MNETIKLKVAQVDIAKASDTLAAWAGLGADSPSLELHVLTVDGIDVNMYVQRMRPVPGMSCDGFVAIIPIPSSLKRHYWDRTLSTRWVLDCSEWKICGLSKIDDLLYELEVLFVSSRIEWVADFKDTM